MRRKSPLPLPRLALAALSALALLLSACQNLVQTPRPPVEALAGTGELLEARPGDTRQVKVRLAQGAESAEVYLRLADPCAKGTSYCPGWDATRYPGVEHTRERFTLTATNLEATFTLSVAQDALPQGPFKWELVAVDQGGREWTFPVYLRIPYGDRGAVETLREWRARAGLPGVEEDPEWAWRAWLHSRYMAMNHPNELSHDEDLSQPFASEEGRSAGRVGNETHSFRRLNGQPSWSPDQNPVNAWMTGPFHRFNLTYPWPLRVGSGAYRDVGPVPGLGDGWGRSWFNFPNLSPWTSDRPVREVLFPAPGMRLPLAAYQGRENPNPTYPCSHPEAPRQRPFLTQEGLTWDDGQGVVRNPIGFPVTLMTFARADTEVLEARVVRVSDQAVNPVCAYGSLQYWEDRSSWRDVGLRILQRLGAVIIFPHEPLTPGAEYEVHLKAEIGSQVWERSWRFQVE
ncbi:CAP domain-containing protein [Thermus tengchongensis]|uniref:CAP domain-containing protein n=1 Tax=Thermus tengchongensis TaxID=1214928 RepID=A0ABY2K6G5_9DEIN|nr:CAP domain-containing protein [Thermus tengchongensis]TFU14401.1 CAP domain-containing protein [Thermus tengchongensis]